MEPKIGIVICGFTDGNKQFVSNDYIQSVRYSGGIPLVLPLVRSDHMIEQYASLCDGFLFCGGNDITPLLFGQEPKNGNGKTNITMKRILKTGKAMLAICRGMQIYNVACDGSIYQDISLQPGRHLDHMQQSKERSEVSHKIMVEPGSQLRNYIGQKLYVNSYHHQSIENLGNGLIACTRASDKTIEALEMI